MGSDGQRGRGRKSAASTSERKKRKNSQTQQRQPLHLEDLESRLLLAFDPTISVDAVMGSMPADGDTSPTRFGRYLQGVQLPEFGFMVNLVGEGLRDALDPKA